MKKLYSLLCGVLFALTLCVFASASNDTVTHSLTADGKSEITVARGEVITVRYAMCASDVQIQAAGNEIFYDKACFELVSGSIKTAAYGYNGTKQRKSGGREYVYFNTMNGRGIEGELVIGTFQLRALARSGETVIRSDYCEVCDASGGICCSILQNLTVRFVAVAPKSVTVSGYVGQQITLDDVYFDPEHDFDGATTTFSATLARNSMILAELSRDGRNLHPSLSALGFTDVQEFDFTRTTDSPKYQTGYYTASRSIQRGGRSCTLLLITVHSNSDGDSMAENFDFLNYGITGSSTDFDENRALTFTQASEYILNGHDNAMLRRIDALRTRGEDYLIWITGHSRGGAVGNYLAKLLVDRCGTGHVTAYLFGAPNNDKGALHPNQSSRYNCIFNLLNPDDPVTYVPFDDTYDGWGFRRWGRDLHFRAPQSSEELYSALTQKYAAYNADCVNTGSSLLNTTYYTFPEGQSGGAAMREAITEMRNSIAPSIRAYYKTPITIRRSTGLTIFTRYSSTEVSYVPYELFQSFLNDEISLVEGYKLARGSYYNNCAATKTLRFTLLHALGITDLDDFALDAVTDSKNISLTLHEAISAHPAETYLVWLSLAQDGIDIFRDSTATDSTHCLDSLTSGEISVSGTRCFYDDQTFSANQTVWGCRLSLRYPDGVPCDSYGAVTLSFPAQSDMWVLFRASDGHTELRECSYDAATHRAAVQLGGCSGDVLYLNSGEQVVLSGYDVAGKMLWAHLAQSVGTERRWYDSAAEAVRLFPIGQTLSPEGAAIYKTTAR